MARIVVPKKADWILPVDIISEDFKRIFDFFVIKSPVDGLSSRQKSLSDYGWETPWRKPFCLRRQLNNLSSNSNLLFSAKNLSLIDVEMEKSDLLIFPPSDLKNERVCFHNNKHTQYLSLFNHIRNALAHGRFNIIELDGDIILIMEDVASRQKGLREGEACSSARMILKVSTLINWIELIENGEKPIC